MKRLTLYHFNTPVIKILNDEFGILYVLIYRVIYHISQNVSKLYHPFLVIFLFSPNIHSVNLNHIINSRESNHKSLCHGKDMTIVTKMKYVKTYKHRINATTLYALISAEHMQ